MRVFVLILFIFFNQQIFSQVVKHQLIARNSGLDTLWDGTTIRTMGFAKGITDNVQIPSVMLTFTEGDSIEIDLWNISQGAPHTIHLHGLDVDQQNDGVGHLSFYVHHMDHGYYRFKAPHPGTYLYHCHVVSPVHVQGGMYGMIVVKPKGVKQLTWENGYEYNREFNLLTSEVDTNWHHNSIIGHAYDTMGHFKMTLPPYLPQFFLINGKSETELNEGSENVNGKANESIYLRLANIGNLGNTYIFPSKLNANVISSDGRELPNSVNTDTLEIYPGERYGVMLNPTSEFYDTIQVYYTNLNNYRILSKQLIPVEIEGFLSIDEKLKFTPKISVYPNPVAEILNLRFTENFTGNVIIYDGIGQIVDVQVVRTLQQTSLNLPQNLSNGIYFVTTQGYPTFRSVKFNISR